jgi:2,4-dienoyl-CoA reductase-like NADH-dependent reductase (Old Yellow Enzyme family)
MPISISELLSPVIAGISGLYSNDVPHLFTPMKIRDLTIPNRIWLTPMCMYSAVDGMPNDWHFAHLAQCAIRRVGFLMTEASGISPTARSTQMDTGI